MSRSEVTDKAIRDWWRRHPEVVPGFDVTPLVALELAIRKRPNEQPAVIQQAFDGVFQHQPPIPRSGLVSALVAAIDRANAIEKAVGVPGKPGRPATTEAEYRSRLNAAVAAARRTAEGEWPKQATIAEEMGCQPRRLRQILQKHPGLREIVRPPESDDRK